MSDFELNLLKERFKDKDEFEKAASLLQNGTPLGYILGEWYFYGLTFRLNEACLMPRPDTEHVVDKALALIPEEGEFNILDLCTGCGCILISILKNRSFAKGLGIDISNEALDAARENATLNEVDGRCSFIRSDIAKDSPPDFTPDIITANPPYIKSGEIDSLQGAVRREPRAALDGGADGLDFYRVIKEKYLPLLQKGGYLILEIGYDQRDGILSLFPDAVVYKDYGGNDRVAVLQKR